MRIIAATILSVLLLSPAFAVDYRTLDTPAGEEFRLAVAGSGDAPTTFLLVHDWFGFRPFLMESVERFAGINARAIAVDLYAGESAATHPGAWELMQNLEREAAAAKIDAAVAASQSSQLVLVGFSMGTSHTLAAAMRHADRVDATILFYGQTINDPERLSGLGGPVLAVYGSLDGNAAEQAAAFSRATDESGAEAEIYVYPGAHHAFAQPLFNQGKTYDPAATAAAWGVVDGFLTRRLAPDSGE